MALDESSFLLPAGVHGSHGARPSRYPCRPTNESHATAGGVPTNGGSDGAGSDGVGGQWVALAVPEADDPYDQPSARPLPAHGVADPVAAGGLDRVRAVTDHRAPVRRGLQFRCPSARLEGGWGNASLDT